jgi:hypothetical protein
MGSVQLFFSLDEFRFLFSEVDKLIEGFLVNMAVFLKFSITLIQFFKQLKPQKKYNKY